MYFVITPEKKDKISAKNTSKVTIDIIYRACLCLRISVREKAKISLRHSFWMDFIWFFGLDSYHNLYESQFCGENFVKQPALHYSYLMKFLQREVIEIQPINLLLIKVKISEIVLRNGLFAKPKLNLHCYYIEQN